MHVEQRNGIHLVVKTEQTSSTSCSVTILLERNAKPLWVRERHVPLIDCDCLAVERTAIHVAAAIADHLARWPTCTLHCSQPQHACPDCNTFLKRERRQSRPPWEPPFPR